MKSAGESRTMFIELPARLLDHGSATHGFPACTRELGYPVGVLFRGSNDPDAFPDTSARIRIADIFIPIDHVLLAFIGVGVGYFRHC